jgi:hypothetical protein
MATFDICTKSVILRSVIDSGFLIHGKYVYIYIYTRVLMATILILYM